MTPTADYMDMPWRVGSQVGRTIYAQAEADDKGVLIGVMDTPELADDVVKCHNRLHGLPTTGWRHREPL